MHHNRRWSVLNVYFSFPRDIDNSDPVNYGPNPANNYWSQDELKNAVADASSHMVSSRAGVYHSSNARQEDVQKKADPSKSHACGVDILTRTHNKLEN